MTGTGRFDLTGQVAVVTGGNRGIGLGIVTALVEAGCEVAIWARDEARTEAAIAGLPGASARVVGITCDVSSQADVTAALASTVRQLGDVDACFANAGIAGKNRPFSELTVDEWRQVVSVNLEGALFTLQATSRHMVEKEKGGSLVVTSSLTALQGAARSEAYAASKAGLIAMVRGLAVELARHGIRANAIVPGWIDTELTHDMLTSEAFRDRVLPRVPLRRWGTPDDIGTLAVYLASRAAGYHTGDVLVVDGAYSIF